MQKLKIGFIGAGNFIRENHLLTARNSSNMEIAAIADLDEKLLADYSANWPVGYVTADYTEILKDAEIPMVVIGTKQDLHAKLIVESLNAGKWVFCEKPMAENAEEGRMVLEAERDADGYLGIGFNRRFAPAYKRVKSLLNNLPRPWFVNYRMMYPNPDKNEGGGFYYDHARILYEGCHILDYVSYLFEEPPCKVYMTGDRNFNNHCILSYTDGSQVSFICGSFGSYFLWKEYVEIFAKYAAITVQDFIDMRVRGIPDEYDALYAPHLKEHAAEIATWGFDFYELYKSQYLEQFADYYKNFNMDIVKVKRPAQVLNFNVSDYHQENPELWNFVPDKGWVASFEHFAECCLSGQKPDNADGNAGKLATDIAEALLRSLESGLPENFK